MFYHRLAIILRTKPTAVRAATNIEKRRPSRFMFASVQTMADQEVNFYPDLWNVTTYPASLETYRDTPHFIKEHRL